ncbi:PA14 domain-containing protein [Horticoccus sp. 23ND18S-11]|uniref:PA14 domain-containing protein n=1 Tax=Horticoccus sp. 23ND18S-11 TaxID=3391832 RepID=UPI0039C90576
MTTFRFGRGPALHRSLGRLLVGFMAVAAVSVAHAAIQLSALSFTADHLPSIEADAADVTAAQSLAGPGGYYKLRAKFIVSYSPGYFHGTDATNNNHGRLSAAPAPGAYTVQLYWAAYDFTGDFKGTGPFYSYNININPAVAGGTGLTAQYFNGNNFQSLARTAASGEVPNYWWGGAGPNGTGSDNFSIRWSGFVEPLHSETYTFTIGSDDGMRVYIENLSSPVAEAWWDHGYFESSGAITLNAGQRYRILVEFFENYGGAEARLFWESPSQQREIIPLSRLSPAANDPGPVTPQTPAIATSPQSQTVNVGDSVHFTVAATGTPAPSYQWRKGQTPLAGATGTSLSLASTQLSDAGNYDVVVTNTAGTATSGAATLTVVPTAAPGTGNGLRGDYYSGTGFNTIVTTRTDAAVDFDWGTGTPAPGVPVDNFSVRWSGQVEAPVTGYYIFSTLNDDGVRLKLGGNTLIDDWTGHAPADRFSGQIYLTAGSKTEISLEYFESGGGAVVRLYWQPPGSARTVIPQSRLHSTTTATGGSWENLLTETRFITFTEEIDGDGNGTGNWSSTLEMHPFQIPTEGTLRIRTTGGADTYGWLNGAAGNSVEPWLEGGGEGENFHLERPINAGAYQLFVTARFRWTDSDLYSVYVDFKPDATRPSINSPLTATTLWGAPFTYQITASPAATSYRATGLPSGLVVNPSGLISGTPNQVGTFSMMLEATANGLTDAKVLSLTVNYLPPSCTISANVSNITAGGQAIITVAASSPSGTLRYINVDQVSPATGHYGLGDTGGEFPPNNSFYPATNGTAQTRSLTVTINTPGTYTFRGAVGDGAGWFFSPTSVTVTASAGLQTLTVHNGTGSGSFATNAVVPISAHAPSSGFAFSHWSLVNGPGAISNPALGSTTFTMANGSATIAANYLDIQSPSVPTGLTATNVTAASFTLNWNAAVDNVATSAYEARRDATSVGISGSPSLPISGLTAGTTYEFTVRAVDVAGNWSPWSAPLSLTAGQGPSQGDSTNLNRLNIHLPSAP